MKDLEIELEDRPGSLAAMGEALARAGVSIEGGGAWLSHGPSTAHFLFQDGAAAHTALEAAGIKVVAEREVLVQRLKQDEPGQLGKLTRRMADAGVNIQTLYSDHEHRMILVVDNESTGRAASETWEAERAALAAPHRAKHHYAAEVEWTGNDGTGTQTYRSYRRDHTISAGGKPVIAGSSDPAFRGDSTRYNPEELLVASLSACHMLTYLHLCVVNKVIVAAYVDQATGTMAETADGSGFFESVVLHPAVIVAADTMLDKARTLHHEAHRLCFIARSVNFPVECRPVVSVQGTKAYDASLILFE